MTVSQQVLISYKEGQGLCKVCVRFMIYLSGPVRLFTHVLIDFIVYVLYMYILLRIFRHICYRSIICELVLQSFMLKVLDMSFQGGGLKS